MRYPIFLLAILLFTSSLSLATRPDSAGPILTKPNNSRPKPKPTTNNKASGSSGGPGGFFGPGFGYDIPGMGEGWDNGTIGGGYGSGYGGPSGGYSKGGIIRNTVVCKERGPCYKKKVRCPAKCFTSYSRSGKDFGAGGGGGGCTIDCQKNCTAYC